jgi:hypothetical protein
MADTQAVSGKAGSIRPDSGPTLFVAGVDLMERESLTQEIPFDV